MATAGPFRADERDWSATPLGPADRWSPALAAAVRVMHACREPMFIWWGAELVQLGNEAFATLFGRGTESSDGIAASEAWRANWSEICNVVENSWERSGELASERILLTIDSPASGTIGQHWFALQSLVDVEGGVGGVLGVYEGGRRSPDSLGNDRASVLLAIEDVKLRDHVRRLVGAAYDLSVAASLEQAVNCVRANQPDLVIACGAAPLSVALRADPKIGRTPILELADDAAERPAGEQEGVLTIPFSARELLARMDSILTAVGVRRVAEQRENQLRAEVLEERTSVEAALRQSERRYRQVVQGLPAAVYTCDAAGRVQLYNDAAIDLWGQSPAIGESSWCGSCRLFRSDGTPVPLGESPMAVTLREGRASPGEELVIERPDGTRRRVIAHPQPLLDTSGALLGAVNMLVDVTAQKAAEAELATTKDDLALQVKALTRLHDLAAPLAGNTKLEPQLHAILETLVEIHEADFGLLLLFDAATNSVCTGASAGLDDSAIEGITAAMLDGADDGEATLIARQPQLVEDVELAGTERMREAAHRAGFRAVHGTPIVARSGEFMGLISVYFRQPRQVIHRERQLADLCARHAADELESARSRQALRESEDRFGMFMKHLPGLAWIKDVEGRYVYVNDAAERAFQKPRTELYGLTDEDLFPAATARQFRENDHRTLIGEGPVEAIESIEFADGWRHSLVSKFVVPNAAGEPTMIGGIAIDMTERIKDQQALCDSEERFRTITMNAPVAIFIKDLEGRYTLCNPLASLALGRPEGATGFTDHELLPAEAADLIRRRDLEIIESGEAAENEELVPADGVERQFLSVKFPLRNSAGETTGVCGVAVDVTERKQTQQALLESERRLVVATQAGKVGVWAWDLVANRVSWSESLQSIVGIGPGDLASAVDDFETLVHPDDRLRVQQTIEHALAHEDTIELEFRAMRSDGDFIWLYTNAAVLREEGRAVRLLGATLDITERKRGEIALRESEDRFRTLASHAPVGIWQSDAEGRMVFVNEGWRQMAGLTAEQARGDEWANALHPEDRPRIMAGWSEAVRAGRTFDAEFRFLHPDGQVIWLQGNAVPLCNPAGRVDGYIGTIVDVTGRKEVEAALRNSERMYRAIGDSIDYGIWVCDPEGNNIYCSESFLNLIGMTQEECSGTGWGAALHPDDVDQTLAAWQECVRMGDAWDVEHRFRGVDGEWRPVLARGVPVKNDRGEIIAWVGINLDISELKRVENDLRESEARFRNVADNAPVLIWMNGAGGCQFVNKEYLAYAGCPVEKLLGMGWADYLHPQDADAYVDKFLTAFDKKQPFESQVRMRRADGEYRWFSSTGTPRFRADGEFLGFIGCSVDITEIKSSEEALREADRRKDDFLAMLGHELRNPLAGIVTGAQVLSMLDLDAEAGEMQAVIARQATYMSRIVDDLLDVSRIARGKLRLRHQHANLRELLSNAVEDYLKGHPLQDCDLRLDVPDEEAWVWADAPRLTQAFSNVIHNACKFSDGPNVVSVVMSIDRDARQAKVVVTDRGIGMSAETVARIFQPFIQADTSLERSRGGLGLGLALGRGLIHLHGGDVTAASPGLGQGSSFTIMLPLVAAPRRQDDYVQSPATEPTRVLIIDDRRDAILPLRKMLEKDGHAVDTAENGPAGLERATQFQPDIVLCDIGLVGEMDGYGVSRALRALPEFSDVYLVAVTGYGHEEARRMAKEAGFDFHLTKPVSMQQVRHLVSRRPNFS